MPKFTTEINSVVCIDDEYIDTNEIAKISKIEPVDINNIEDDDEYVFNIMFKGHSNIMFVNSDDKLSALLKRKFIIDRWTYTGIESVPIFDFKESVEEFEEMQRDEEEDDEDLN